METLLETERIYSPAIVMEFGIENCAMQMKIRFGKRQMTEWIQVPNQENLQVFGNIRSRLHQTRKDERKK